MAIFPDDENKLPDDEYEYPYYEDEFPTDDDVDGFPPEEEIALEIYYENYNLVRDIDYVDFLEVIRYFLDEKHRPITKYLNNGLFRLREKEVIVCNPGALKWLILGFYQGYADFI
jgi:hypothetical protein